MTAEVFNQRAWPEGVEASKLCSVWEGEDLRSWSGLPAFARASTGTTRLSDRSAEVELKLV